MTVSGIASTCIVFRGTSDSAILVPLQVTGNLQEALRTYPAAAAVKRAAGAPKEFQIDSAVSLVALSASLGETGTSGSRQHVRLNVNFKVDISTDETTWHSTLGENISEGGLLAFNPTLVPVSASQRTVLRKIMVRIYLPGLTPISAVGVVVRTENPQGTTAVPGKIGIRFTSINREDVDQIAGFIRRM